MESLKSHPGPPCSTLLCPAIRPFQEWPAHRAGGLGQFSTPLDIPRRTLMSERVSQKKIRLERQWNPEGHRIGPLRGGGRGGAGEGEEVRVEEQEKGEEGERDIRKVG
jgi:hypothetical protein